MIHDHFGMMGARIFRGTHRGVVSIHMFAACDQGGNAGDRNAQHQGYFYLLHSFNCLGHLTPCGVRVLHVDWQDSFIKEFKSIHGQ